MAYHHASDEGLPEVVTDPSPEALTEEEARYHHHQQQPYDKYYVAYDDAPKLYDEAGHDMVRSPDGSVPGKTRATTEGTASGQENTSEKAEDAPRICGVRRKIFLLLLIAALVVVATAVGGGVGGGVAAARSRQGSGSAVSSSSTSALSSGPSSPSSETSSSTTPTSTLPSATTGSSSSPSPTVTFLNNQTESAGFGFQGFSGANFSGAATQIYRDEGFFDLPFDAWSYVWAPNGTSCCLTFCEDRHNATGWRCQFRNRTEASDPFPRIYIWCDPSLIGIANGTCS